jgi:hypothetical protein
MPAHKLSVSVDEPVFLATTQAAERRGTSLSAWLNDAAERALETEVSEVGIETGLAGVAEFEAENGQLSEEELAEADAILDAAGVGRKPASLAPRERCHIRHGRVDRSRTWLGVDVEATPACARSWDVPDAPTGCAGAAAPDAALAAPTRV